MPFRHGAYITESPTPLTPPVQADSALPVAFGAAPVHRLEKPSEAVNTPLLINGFQEGAAKMGYSDNWKNFGLSEVLYSQFMVHNVAPLVAVNVWDPLADAVPVAAVQLTLTSGVAAIKDAMAMISTVQVQKSGSGVYERDKDYTLAYKDDALIITVISGGAVPAGTAALTVTYKRADISKITEADVIGGIDAATKKRTGVELTDEVYLRYRKNPGFLLAPGWSHKPAVAAALIAKAKGHNNDNFSCIALLDLPTDSTIKSYEDVPAWKNSNGYNSPYAFTDWPCTAIDNRVFHASTRLAGVFGETDARRNGKPYVSSSNKALTMTGVCREDGTELQLLDQGQANFLNENGIGTFLNWDGWRAWGNETSAYPAVTDVKDAERSIRRMFNWAQNTVNRTVWQYVDGPINYMLIDRVKLTVNQFLNALVAEGAILGGRVDFLKSDNNALGIMSGRLYFRVRLTPPGAAKDITFDFQYDPGYLETLFKS